MKTYALIDENNKVLNISVADSSWDATGWVEVPENNPAYINGDYHEGYFYPEQPFASWTRSNGQWVAPIAKPIDEKLYDWDEGVGNWVEFTN
jgi:hypothetical protein